MGFCKTHSCHWVRLHGAESLYLLPDAEPENRGFPRKPFSCGAGIKFSLPGYFLLTPKYFPWRKAFKPSATACGVCVVSLFEGALP